MKKYHRIIWFIILTIVITPIATYLYLPQFAKISILEKICTTTAILCITSTLLALLFFGFDDADNGSDYNSGQVNF